MAGNEKHRPPHGKFKIQECIKIGHYDEAQKYTDENVAFYDAKIGEQQDLFLEAQCGKMGVEYNRDNKLGAAIHSEKRRVPTSRLYGKKGINDEC